MGPLRGIAAILAIAFNTFWVYVPLTAWAIQRLWTRGEARRRLIARMDKIALWWTGGNRWALDRLGVTNVEVDWPERDQVSPDNWYLIVCNHQSWTDILILQSHLWGVIPVVKFFTKQELIWVPGVGLAMYLLGYPYVKRATPGQIRANPELKHLDRDNTLAACEGFKNHPTAILSFLEGTRFTAAKHHAQRSEYAYLLKPRIGGLSYVLSSMHDHVHKLLDVTIDYPDGVPTFWQFLQGHCRRVHMRVRHHDIPQAVIDGLAGNDKRPAAAWLAEIWHDKDRYLIARRGDPATLAAADGEVASPDGEAAANGTRTPD